MERKGSRGGMAGDCEEGDRGDEGGGEGEGRGRRKGKPWFDEECRAVKREGCAMNRRTEGFRRWKRGYKKLCERKRTDLELWEMGERVREARGKPWVAKKRKRRGGAPPVAMHKWEEHYGRMLGGEEGAGGRKEGLGEEGGGERGISLGLSISEELRIVISDIRKKYPKIIRISEFRIVCFFLK